MFKKIEVVVYAGLSLIIMSGCVALVAGAAGGAGTAAWLSGKLSQELTTPYEKAIGAAKSGLKSLKLEVTKETREENVTQIKSKYSDGREVWIDVRRINDTLSRVEVRVGLVGDKDAAAKILKQIVDYL